MPLPYLNFCERTSCYIASLYLQFSRQLFLRQPGFFSQNANIIPYCLFRCFIHTVPPLHLFKNKILDFIICFCYNVFALI